MLIIMAGLPGTGKSTVAAELVPRIDAVILSKDAVRHALFPSMLIEYSTQQDDFVVELLMRTAEYIWSKDPEKVIILDGRTFSLASQRQRVIALAEKAHQSWRIVECVCHEEVAKSRLGQPDPSHPARNRTPSLYDVVKRRWEPIAEDHFRVRTDQTVKYEDIVAKLVS